MNTRRRWLLYPLLCLVLVLGLVNTALAAGPSAVQSFDGNLTIAGANAPAGTVIIAKVAGTEYGRLTTVTAGQYGKGLDAKLVVQGAIDDGATVDFYITNTSLGLDKVKTAETALFDDGEITERNLSVTDTAAPALTINALTPDPNDDSTPTFTGTATDAVSKVAAVEYKVGNGSWTAATAVDGAFDSSSENYTFTTAALTDGSHTVYVRATDTASPPNTTADGFYASDTFVIDTAAPTVSSVTSSHADGSFKSGEVIGISATYNEAVTVNTTGGTPTLALNSGGSASYTSGSGTVTLTFTYTVGAGQTSGDLDYSATDSLALNGGTIKDAAGNEAVNTLPAVGTFAEAHAIVIDTTVPTVGLTTTATSPTKVSPIPVTATFSEAVTGFVVGDITVGSGTAGNFVAVSGTVYIFDVTPTAQGAVTVDVGGGVAQDAAGNDNTATQLSITYDSTAPEAPTGLSASAYINNANKAAYAVSGAAEAGSTVTVTITDSASAMATGTGTATGGAFSINVNAASLAEGTASITAKATDSAGNISASSAALSRTKDTVAPSVAIDAVVTPTETSVQTLTGTMEAGATVALTSATATFGAVSYPTATTWSSQVSLGQGSNSITATATDVAGNTATASITVFLTPSVTINAVTSPTNVATQTLTGTRTAGATVALSTSTGTTFGSVSYPTTTTWSAVVTLVEGTNMITAAVGSSTATATIVLDTVAPTVQSVSPANDATGIAVTSVVTATFSEDMDASTITASSFTLGGSVVAGTVSYNTTTRVAMFTPSAAFDPGKTYTATLSTAVKDSVGNSLAAAYSWSFTTAAGSLGDLVGETLPGGTVELGAGTYTGNVTIDKPITIIGTNGTVITGGITIEELTGSNVTIENLTITGYADFGIRIVKVKAGDVFTIRNSIIQGVSGSIVGIEVDELVSGGSLTIERNSISGNQIGVKLLAVVADADIRFNDITNNTTAGIQIAAGGNANAEKNWWGDISGPKVQDSNPGGVGGTMLGTASFEPWLTRGFQTALTDNIGYFGFAMVKLAAGWNILSTPIALDPACDTWGEYVNLGDGLAVHAISPAWRFDGSTQNWVLLASDYQLKPCDAIYVRMASADVAPILYSPDMSVPSKGLYTGWNLIGLANPGDMSVRTALASVYKVPGDLTGYSQVVSPSIGNQTAWVYVRDGSPETIMEKTKGYWVFMVNAPAGTTLAGFAFTPISLGT